jgi:hypothetical protein
MRTSRVAKGFWRDRTNRRSFFDKIMAKQSMVMDDWYSTLPTDVRRMETGARTSRSPKQVGAF